jgi:hypothetical protein
MPDPHRDVFGRLHRPLLPWLRSHEHSLTAVGVAPPAAARGGGRTAYALRAPDPTRLAVLLVLPQANWYVKRMNSSLPALVAQRVS